MIYISDNVEFLIIFTFSKDAILLAVWLNRLRILLYWLTKGGI